MILKVVGVLLLATLAYSQEGRSVQYPSSLSTINETQDNFENATGVIARQNNFFCLERVTTMEDGYLVVTYEGYENRFANVWTVFVQFPLLAFLDTNRKRALIDIIVSVLNTGSGTNVANAPMSVDDVCLGPYTAYGVTTFQESVLIHIYGNSTTFDALAVSNRFMERVNAERNQPSGYVINYPGQSNIIAFNLSESTYYDAAKLHPGGRSSDGADPTALAVFLASFGGNYTIDGISNDAISRNLNRETIEDDYNFAENPNPVNYGVEPGDIIFAIIAGLLTVLVCAVTIFGYGIHPFLWTPEQDLRPIKVGHL